MLPEHGTHSPFSLNERPVLHFDTSVDKFLSIYTIFTVSTNNSSIYLYNVKIVYSVGLLLYCIGISM
jgi:hypothetical protein